MVVPTDAVSRLEDTIASAALWLATLRTASATGDSQRARAAASVLRTKVREAEELAFTLKAANYPEAAVMSTRLSTLRAECQLGLDEAEAKPLAAPDYDCRALHLAAWWPASDGRSDDL